MPSLSLEQIKENIAVARKQARITQKEMSKLLDISQLAYSYYEKGENPIALNKIQKICDILSIPMKSLIGDIGIDENDEEILMKINGNLEQISNTLDKLYDFVIKKIS